jgi:hypothetical protein
MPVTAAATTMGRRDLDTDSFLAVTADGIARSVEVVRGGGSGTATGDSAIARASSSHFAVI